MRRGWRRSGGSGGGRRAWRRRGRRRRARAARRPPARRPGRSPRRPSDSSRRRPTCTSASAARARSAASAAASPATPGRTSTNSSPPSRPTASPSRTTERSLVGGGGQRLVALGVAERVVDALEVVEVDDGDAERRAGERGGLDLAPQDLLRAAVVEQAGEAVGGGLVAQVLALAGGLVGERGHRGEALDERHLGVGERAVVAGAVDVERAHDAVVGEQRDADERLVVVVGPRDDGADRVEAAVGDVPRAAVANDPAGGAAVDRQRLGHDLRRPTRRARTPAAATRRRPRPRRR